MLALAPQKKSVLMLARIYDNESNDLLACQSVVSYLANSKNFQVVCLFHSYERKPSTWAVFLANYKS